MISFGFCLRQPLQLLIVENAVLLAHAVLHRVEPFAGHVGRGAMGEMPASGQRHAEDGIARLAPGPKTPTGWLGAGIGLHIGETRRNSFFARSMASVSAKSDRAAAAVIALAGIALGVFVGQHRSLRGQHGGARRCFRTQSARCRPARAPAPGAIAAASSGSVSASGALKKRVRLGAIICSFMRQAPLAG